MWTRSSKRKSDLTKLLIIAYGYALRVGLRSLIESDPTLEVIADVGGIESIPEDYSDASIILSAAESYSEGEIEEIIALASEEIGLLLLTDDSSVLSSFSDVDVSWGVLPFNAVLTEVKAAIQAVAAGLIVVSPSFLGDSAETAVFMSGFEEADTLVEPLTPRELEVLDLLALGHPNKKIAAQLVISEHTVKFHISSVYGKLGAANRAEAVRLGVRLGLISV